MKTFNLSIPMRIYRDVTVDAETYEEAVALIKEIDHDAVSWGDLDWDTEEIDPHLPFVNLDDDSTEEA